MTARHCVLVTVDTLRADHLSGMGYMRPTTPKLDALAAGEGVVFRQAYAHAPHTAGSMPSLFTSAYPFMHGGEGYVDGKGLTMAEGLQGHGFATAGFHSNPFLSRAYGHDKGFDSFHDNFRFGVARPLILLQRAVNYVRYEPYLTGRQLNAKAFRWLQVEGRATHQDGGRFFLWLHYMNVHGPYHPPAEYQRMFVSGAVSRRERHRLWKKMIHHGESITAAERELLVGLYDAEIRCMDDCFAALLDELDRLGLRRDSVVVVTADHGEEFGEHRSYQHLKQLYDEVLHVPLILFGGGLAKGAVIGEVVRLIDVAPTVFEVLGLERPPHFLGQSLVPLIKGTASGLGLEVFCQVIGRRNGEKTRKFALRSGELKWIVEYDSAGAEVGRELYDTATDPGETVDIASQQVEWARVMDHRIREYINRTNGLTAPLATASEDAVDAQVKDRLRDLGYIE